MKNTSNILPVAGAAISVLGLLLAIGDFFGTSEKMAAAVGGTFLAFLLGLFAKQLGALARRLPHKKRVFVSYSMQDQAVAAPYIEILKSLDARLWVASEQLPSGAPIKDSIERAVNDADRFVGLLTGRVSPNMMFELGVAAQRGTKVVLVLLADTELPADISGMQVIDMRQDQERGLKELRAVVS